MEERTVSAADLKQVKPFNSLHKKTLEELVRLGSISVYQPHDVLYTAGTINKKLIIILRGSVTLGYKYDSYDVPIEILEEGDLWGYTTILKPGKKYPYDVVNNARVTETIELPVVKVLKSLEQNKANHNLVYELAQLQRTRSRQRQEKVALLFGLATIMNTTNESRKILNELLELLTNALDAERALIASFDDITKQIIIEETHNYTKKVAQARYALTADTLLSLVYNTDEPLRVTEKEFERKFGSAPYSRPSMMITPLRMDSTVYGALLLADKKDGSDFTAEDALILDASAPYVASALAQINRREEVKNEGHMKNDYVLPLTK